MLEERLSMAVPLTDNGQNLFVWPDTAVSFNFFWPKF